MRRAIVVFARPSARICATYACSSLVVACPGDPPRCRATSTRSRRYASTVRGARRAAPRTGKEATAGSLSIRLLSSRWGSFLRSGTRMRGVVDLPQPLRVDVRVHLRRRERRMAEQLLNRAQVGAAFEQVRRERVAQAVRMGDEPPQRRGVEPLPTRRQEERVACPRSQFRPRVAEVPRDPRSRFLAERHDAILRTFSVAHMDEFLLEVDVAEVEADGLG